MRRALDLYNIRGWTIKRVAESIGFSRQTMARYLRVHDKYGIDAFIPLVARK